MARLLVTRPRDQATTTKALLEARGHQVSLEPVLSIHAVAHPAIDLSRFDGLAITSAHAAPAAAALRPDIPVFAVGDATAGALKDNHVDAVSVGKAGGRALAEDIDRALAGRKGQILHLTGRHRSGELEGALTQRGHGYCTTIVYEARESETISPETESLLVDNRLDGICFFSRRSAEIFCRLSLQDGLQGSFARLDAFCLADTVAEGCAGLPWRQIRVADAPNVEALCHLLEQAW